MLESLFPDILFISFVQPMEIIKQDVLSFFFFFSLGFAQARKISQDRREQSWVSVWINT